MGSRIALAAWALLSVLWCGLPHSQGSRLLVDDEAEVLSTGCNVCDNWSTGMPICNSRGKALGSNVCEAVMCMEAEIEDIGFCGDQRRVQSSCSCDPTEWNPVCNSKGRVVAWNAGCARCISTLLDGEYGEAFCSTVEVDGDVLEGPKVGEDEYEQNDFFPTSCICPTVAEWVCFPDGSKAAINSCKASCDPTLEGANVSEAYCKPDLPVLVDTQLPVVRQGVPEATEASQSVEDDCICPTVVQYVCFPDGSHAATNACFASCDPSLADADVSEANCKSDLPVLVDIKLPADLQRVPEVTEASQSVEDDCICPTVVQYVCFPDGSHAATNACFASCDPSLADADVSEANCVTAEPEMTNITLPADDVISPDEDEGAGPTSEPECSCPPAVSPVCFSDGSYAASNACYATCKPHLAGADLSEAYCPSYKPNDSTDSNGTEPYSPPAGSAGCLCPLTYIPYCNATGHEVASNSCEAECKGYNITEGADDDVSNENCYKHERRRLQAVYCDLPCNSQNPEPLCDIMGRTVSSSACAVWCQGLFTDMNKYNTFYCDTGSDASTGISSSGSSTKSSASADVAEYEEETAGIDGTTEDNEEEGPGQVQNFCICPLIFSPVCNAAGDLLGSNACEAECNGHDAASFSPENCPESLLIEMGALPPKVDSPDSWTDEPCDCSDDDQTPVCGVDGTVVAKNACEAECSGLKWGIDVSYSFCHDQETLPSFGVCGCNPDEYDPQCLEDGTWVSPSMCYVLCYELTTLGPLVPCPEA